MAEEATRHWDDESLAATVGASRTFDGGLVVAWTPSTTTNSVSVTISIGGSLIWAGSFSGNGEQQINASGQTWSVTGGIAVQFSGSGANGQLSADNLQWTIGGTKYSYTGLIGVW